MRIVWLGHSCFKIEDGEDSILIDPYKSVPGLKEIKEKSNIVLVTHNHSDHNALEKIEIQEKPTCFDIKTIKLSHDSQGGKVRGENNGFVIDNGKYKIAHLGDIGCELSIEQIKQLKNLDVLLIPVGGTYTISAIEAVRIIEILKPRIAIPMHYKDADYGFGFDKLEEINVFITSVKDVIKMDESAVEIDNLPFKIKKIFGKYKTKTVILKPQNMIMER